MTTIIGMAGSLRQSSFNAALLRAAAAAVPAGCTVDIASIRGIPLYDGDVGAATGVPDVVEHIRERLRIYMTGFVAFVQQRPSSRGASKHTSLLTFTQCTAR
jgi:NADPH-dependent FMN reductase